MSIAEFNRFIGSEREKIFTKIVLSWKSKDQIIALYDDGVSPTQLAKLFEYERGLSVFDLEEVVFHAANGTTKVVAPFNQSMSSANFSSRLKQIVPYSSKQLQLHLEQPQWKKIRFHNLDKSEYEVKSLVKKQLQQWAKDTCNKRKSKGIYYSPKYQIDYWIKQTDTREQAQFALDSFKRSISPMTLEFWTKKGFDINEAKKIISSQGRKGAHATLAGLNGRCTSLLEKRIFEIIKTDVLSQQIFLGPYSYDIGSKKLKKLIEVNGTYWHADPRVFHHDNTLFGTKKASEIWLADSKKIEYAKRLGYQVHVVWELDFCKTPNQVIESINTFLLEGS